MSENEFKILCALVQNPGTSQRGLTSLTGLSLGTVNRTMQRFREAGWVDADLRVTSAGQAALEPHKVENAVILAAGLSSRFAPLSYEKPKGLLKVKGEVLIERQIRQLQQAGITDITVVIGYMKEKFFYLADKMGVKLVINEDYYRYNNTSSLLPVLDQLGNTYICSSDDYFSENVFEPYVYSAYYSTVFTPEKTDEYCVCTDRKGRITKVTVGGGPEAWCMLGHVYFDRAFSETFRPLLRKAFDERPRVREMLWEDFYMEHLKELTLYRRVYDADVIHEFDSLDELRAFDPQYINNTDSQIFRNITGVLHCAEKDICGIEPIKAGLTNTSFLFSVGDRKYVYRHPGKGTSGYIHRDSESASMKVAKELGLDDTFLYMDEQKGWKLAHYIENARTLDYHDPEQVKTALGMMRRLHDANLKSAYDFNIWEQTLQFIRKISEDGRTEFEDFDALYETISHLVECSEGDHVEKRLCHCDCYDPNFLIDEAGKMYLIDWEYSGNDDPGCDYGTFICCSDYTREEAGKVLELYYGHPMSEVELRHSLAYVAIAAYYWFVWAIFQDSQGKPVGSYLYLWYKMAKSYGAEALALYNKEEQ